MASKTERRAFRLSFLFMILKINSNLFIFLHLFLHLGQFFLAQMDALQQL